MFKKWLSPKKQSETKELVLDLTNEDLAREARELGLFDDEWYVSHSPEVDFANTDPLKHFAEKGYLENKDPSAKFSLSVYLESYPDVARSKLNPLLHYIKFGKKEGRRIADSFQGLTLQQKLEKIKLNDQQSVVYSQLEKECDFQNEWYVKTFSELEINKSVALKHFVLFGASEGLDPSPFFSTKKYTEKYKEHLKGNINPFWHYHTFGKKNGFEALRSDKTVDIDLNVLLEDFKLSSHQQRVALVIETDSWFDKKWYLESLNEQVDRPFAIKHYLVIGVYQGKDPCPLFSTNFYLSKHQDVAKSGINPLYHYLKYGIQKNREIRASNIAGDVTLEKEISEYPLSQSQAKHVSAIEKSNWFNRTWYVNTYSDLNISSNMAIKHYYLFGANEERDPCQYFSTSFYLANNPDVVRSGLNPLFHYIEFGRKESRAILNSKYARIDLSGSVWRDTNSGLQNCHSSSVKESSTDLTDLKIEEQALLSEGNEIHNNLFESLSESYSVDNEIVNAWQTDTFLNIENYFYDIAISKQNSLKVRFKLPKLNQKTVSIEAVQFDSDDKSRRRVSAVNLQVTSMNIAVLELSNVFYPVLLTFKFADKNVFSQLIPFPSLLRGGHHFGELCVHSKSADYLTEHIEYAKQLFAIPVDRSGDDAQKRIHVSLNNAIGNEPLFNRSFMDWQWRFFKVKYISYVPSPRSGIQEKRYQYFNEMMDVVYETDKEVLVNPIDKDTLPTLKLVLSVIDSDVNQSSKVIVPEEFTEGKSKVVRLETQLTNTTAASYTNNLKSGFSFPSSVIQRLTKSNEANELISRPLFKGGSKRIENSLSVSLILVVKQNSQANQARLWDSIRNQKGIDDIDIILALDCPDDEIIRLPQHSSYQQVIVKKSDENYSAFYNRCLLAAKQDIVIHTVETAMFYDNTSLYQLASLLSSSTKSASCKLLCKKPKGKGYELQRVKNSFVAVRDEDFVRLDSPLHNKYYPDNEVFCVFANLPLVVANDKKVLLELLENYQTDDLTAMFIDFGAYLIAQKFSVVASHKFAVGIEYDEQLDEALVELTAATISGIEKFPRQVEERRGC